MTTTPSADTVDTYENLLSQWKVQTAEHARQLREWTETALRGVTDTDAIGTAERLVLKGVETTSDESGAPIYGRDRIEHGPFVRVYDATGNNGDGTYVWAKGTVLIPDHAIETVVMATHGGSWAKVAELAGKWPVRPCSASLDRWPSTDADDAETDEDRAQVNWCAECEHNAPVVRDPKGGWVRIAHDVRGNPISLD